MIPRSTLFLKYWQEEHFDLDSENVQHNVNILIVEYGPVYRGAITNSVDMF